MPALIVGRAPVGCLQVIPLTLFANYATLSMGIPIERPSQLAVARAGTGNKDAIADQIQTEQNLSMKKIAVCRINSIGRPVEAIAVRSASPPPL